MGGDPRDRAGELIVYIDRSDIRAGRLDDLKAGLVRLAQFIESLEPQLISYGFHLDEAANLMTVVAVHPDSASLELHLSVGGPEFRKLADLITLREIDVYGAIPDTALQMLKQKATTLGGANVRVHNRFAGFSHPPPGFQFDEW
jgi:hypothetical protein